MGACFLFALGASTVPAQATLIDRGIFDDGLGGTMHLIYDNDLDITWLEDANFGAGSPFDDGTSNTDGRMTWQNAVNWARSLTVGGFTDWRLPTTTQPDPSCNNQTGTVPPQDYGFGCTGSEMGHLSNVEGITAAAPGVFDNVPDRLSWSSTAFARNPSFAWTFDFHSGTQDASTGIAAFAWAVHDGDVAPAAVPEPGTLLLIDSGLVGLIAWRYRKRVNA